MFNGNVLTELRARLGTVAVRLAVDSHARTPYRHVLDERLRQVRLVGLRAPRGEGSARGSARTTGDASLSCVEVALSPSFDRRHLIGRRRACTAGISPVRTSVAFRSFLAHHPRPSAPDVVQRGSKSPSPLWRPSGPTRPPALGSAGVLIAAGELPNVESRWRCWTTPLALTGEAVISRSRP